MHEIGVLEPLIWPEMGLRATPSWKTLNQALEAVARVVTTMAYDLRSLWLARAQSMRRQHGNVETPAERERKPP